MTVEQVMVKMIDFSQGNLHDIQHFVKVWGYARTIGLLQHLDAQTQRIVQIAAIVHDIACPLCREKYGHADGKLQQKEGPALVRSLLADSQLDDSEIERIAFLVGHHHTVTGVNGIDWQILLQADYLVKADEAGFSHENIRMFTEQIAATASGRHLLQHMYLT